MVALVLLGAGASFGSKDVVPYPPPLGNGNAGLFARLEERSPLAASLPSDLRGHFRRNFEGGMGEYYEYADGDIMQFQRELAAYLAEFQPGPSNEYRKLLEAVNVRRVVFSSLNYDLLFEASAASVGLATLYDVDRMRNAVRLLKPHGSCNFWPDIPVGMFRGFRSARNGAGDVDAPVQVLNRDQAIQRCASDDSFAPAIAMYAEGKSVRVCAPFVALQQEKWRQVVMTASQIFISGVRVHQVDKHIWEPLAASDARVVYFGLGSDRDEFQSWRDKHDRSNAHYVEGDFTFARKMMSARL